MQVNSSNAFRCWATALLVLALGVSLAAKDKNSETVVQGTVFLIDKATSTIMVDTKAGARHVVLYGHDTKFTSGRGDKARESTIDQLQEYQYISCHGTQDAGERLLARECSYREQK